MSPISAFAIFYIIWWVTLFTVLPFGVRSQAEDGEAVLGTERGAPVQPRLLRKLAMTTAISVVIFAAFWYLTITLGFSVDDLPRIVPDFPATRS